MSVQVKRPKDTAGIKALIRERKRNIATIENALKVKHPRDIRTLMLHRLHGEKMSLRSWEDWLANS